MNTATQLKALIRNISKDKKVNAQILLRNFMFERLLERISVSKYSNNFILKGGLLIASMVGVETRSTMDIDATIKGFLVSKKNIEEMIKEIINFDIDDNVNMLFNSIEDIRDEVDYAGFRVSITTNFDSIKQNLKIDITTGDNIIPKEVNYKFDLMLENRSLNLLAYNLETILSEKLETLVSRGTANTRMRDFYDIYILMKLQVQNISFGVLKSAINGTVNKRGSLNVFTNRDVILIEISNNNEMQRLWSIYQKKYTYAKEISWQEIIEYIKKLLNMYNQI